MKKLICLVLVLISAFCVFFGCAPSESEDTDKTEDTAPTIVDANNKKVIDWFDFPAYEERGRVEDVEKIEVSQEYADKCEAYKFSYYSDKYKVKAYIAIPAECIRSEIPYNCIVYNRGGNSNIGWLTGDEVTAMCAATDRIVIASQYRGADGSEGTDEFGGADLEDVITLVDLCDEEFRFANVENLCMAGVSRGGMMSYMAAREDKRVKGVVAVSAVTDLAAAYNEREDMREIMGNYIGGSPEELPEEYKKRSAINWAEELDVPVYIIHSKGDEMVSYTQAKDMNEKLKESKHGRTMTLHLDDVHGMHEEDIKSIAEWLDQELPKTS